MAKKIETLNLEAQELDIIPGKGYTRVKGKTLELGMLVKMSREDKNPTFHEIIVDMADASLEDLYKLAACAIKIKYQARLRDLDPAFVKELSREIRKVKLSDLTAGLEDKRTSVLATARAMFNRKDVTPEEIALVRDILEKQGIDYRL